MKNLIILGAGGMGRQVYQFAKKCCGYNREYTIKGFLDDNPHSMDGFDNYPPVLGTIDNYTIAQDDIFFNSIGDINSKKKSIQKIVDKGGDFITLIHPTASITEGTKVGKGCMISAKVGIGGCSTIGDFCLIQDNAVIGHDVSIGDFSRLDCNTVIIGGVIIGNEVCIHTSAVISHNVTIGDGATVGALSFVIRKVKPGVTVYGNPARQL